MIENKEMTRDDFQKSVEWNELEVYTQRQVLEYGAAVKSLISKSEQNELTEPERNQIDTGRLELANLKPVVVVEQINGRIIKSLFYTQPKQVEYSDTIEKSENGKNIQKGTFLDTELNRKLNRVGEEFQKGCAKKADVTKSEEYDTYKSFMKKGITGIKEEMKKAYPDMDDAKIKEIEKAITSESTAVKESLDGVDEDKEEKEGMENDQITKSHQDIVEKINDNFNKGLIGEDLYESALNQLDTIMKAKYFKREGSPGKYKYYYNKEEYNRAKGGQQKEIGGKKKPTESGKEEKKDAKFESVLKNAQKHFDGNSDPNRTVAIMKHPDGEYSFFFPQKGEYSVGDVQKVGAADQPYAGKIVKIIERDGEKPKTEAAKEEGKPTESGKEKSFQSESNIKTQKQRVIGSLRMASNEEDTVEGLVDKLTKTASGLSDTEMSAYKDEIKTSINKLKDSGDVSIKDGKVKLDSKWMD